MFWISIKRNKKNTQPLDFYIQKLIPIILDLDDKFEAEIELEFPADLIEKQMMLRKQTKPVSQTNESTEGRLLKLAEQFAKFVTGKEPNEKIVTEVVEGEFEMMPPNYVESIKAKEERDNALHAEREKKLQEGATMGAQEEAQQGEGQGSKEPSEVSCG